jgi:hypothetical protein
VGIAVAEHLLHGYDIAVAVGRPWPIDPGTLEVAAADACAWFTEHLVSAPQPRA